MPHLTPFSLFDGDLLNRAFERISLGNRRLRHIAGRCLLVMGVTWAPMAVLALGQQLYSNRIEARNFFADYAAYAQFLIALPLFIVGERIVLRSTSEAAREFVETGLVRDEDLPVVEEIHLEIEQLRLSKRPEIACILIAYVLALATILPELFTQSMRTWHTGADQAGGGRIFTLFGMTLPGLWVMLVALPILNYWWLRLGWKVVVWTRYLYRVSRLHLALAASHPDETGGIAFISEVQAKFALIIFAYGISNVAAVIAYKVGLEGAPLALPPVWGPALGFIVGAPLLFTIPLLMFTAQLFETKQRALTLCRGQALHRTLAFEARLQSRDRGASADWEANSLANLSHVGATFNRIERMRVVPFDFRSASQLVGSTVGSVATVLPLLRIEGPLQDWLELLSAILRRGG
jgi:hypothetical protein